MKTATTTTRWTRLRASWQAAWRAPVIRRLTLAYAALNLLDVLTTGLDLQRDGLGETNVLYAPLFSHAPFAVGAALKLLLATLGWLWITRSYTTRLGRSDALLLLGGLTLVLVGVVAWNSALLLHLV